MTDNKSTEKISDPVELLEKIIALKAGGETRSQQIDAVKAIHGALSSDTNLLLEAPTGSGKTISYLIPLIFNQSRAVITTATKQLSEQITGVDIPFMQKSIKAVAPELKFTAALLKGRDNYYCLAKAEENRRLEQQADVLFSMDSGGPEISKTDAKAHQIGKEIKTLTNWAEHTKTGDRSEAPAVSDDIWRQYSSTSAECPGRNICPFSDQCFAELARENAKKANIVITNHAVVGLDLISEDNPILGERDVYVVDELHELDSYLSSAWGTKLTAKMLKDAHKVFSQSATVNQSALEEVEMLSKKFNGLCSTLEEGVIVGEKKILGEFMHRLYASCSRLAIDSMKDQKEGNNDATKKHAAVIMKKAKELADSAKLLMDDGPDTVRWLNVNEEDDVKTLYAAPLRVGPQLQEALSNRNATLVGTSATIRVSGSFEIPIHNLAMDTSGVDHKTLALSSPFDYPKQAFMYIPQPDAFPAPVGKDRVDHSEAVKKETRDLVEAAGGRALCLYTTSYAARENGKYLREQFPKMNILVQGEAPAPQLIEEFQKDEKSVLVATMGMWHGLDVPGPSCSLVVMDKIPFKPMSDPLSVARQQWAEENGRNGFMDVYVAEANVMLAQGAGRLIRSSKDKGVVAILDTRLLSKRYGSSMLKSLPPMMIFSDKKKVLAGLERLAKTLDT